MKIQFEFKVRVGINTDSIELIPAGTILRGTGTFTISWICLFVEFSR